MNFHRTTIKVVCSILLGHTHPCPWICRVYEFDFEKSGYLLARVSSKLTKHTCDDFVSEPPWRKDEQLSNTYVICNYMQGLEM